jgi:hypothetical protein
LTKSQIADGKKWITKGQAQHIKLQTRYIELDWMLFMSFLISWMVRCFIWCNKGINIGPAGKGKNSLVSWTTLNKIATTQIKSKSFNLKQTKIEAKRKRKNATLLTDRWLVKVNQSYANILLWKCMVCYDEIGHLN